MPYTSHGNARSCWRENIEPGIHKVAIFSFVTLSVCDAKTQFNIHSQLPTPFRPRILKDPLYDEEVALRPPHKNYMCAFLVLFSNGDHCRF